jgi:hypothetical protein
LQTCLEEVPLKLQTEEIQSYRWTSTKFVHTLDPRFFTHYDVPARKFGKEFTLMMPAIRIPNGDLFSNEKISKDPTLVDEAFPLAGMTLRILLSTFDYVP